MSARSMARHSGAIYIRVGRERGQDAAYVLRIAAMTSRVALEHYEQRSTSPDRDEYAAAYRELAEYLEASHARLVARREAAAGDEPATRREPATYDCPCGLAIVDWSDDVDGFNADIAEHEETCDGIPAYAVEETSSRFAPPAGRPWANGGQIPKVEPVTLDCPGRDGFAHDPDDDDYCLACGTEMPPAMRIDARPAFSQVGLMTLVGA